MRRFVWLGVLGLWWCLGGCSCGIAIVLPPGGLVDGVPAGSKADWAIVLGGEDSDVPGGVVLDEAGNAYVAGAYYRKARFGKQELSSQGDFSAFVTKIDAKGEVVWVSASTYGNARAVGLARDKAGNLYTAGSLLEYATFGKHALNLPKAGEEGIFLAKLDPEGTFVWAKAVRLRDLSTDFQAGDAYLKGIALDAKGALYVFGTQSLYRFFTAKFDETGALVWVRILYDGTGLRAGAMALDTTGALVVTGSCGRELVLSKERNITVLSRSGFVVKYSPEGNIQWATTPTHPKTTSANSTHESHVSGVALGADGSVYITGAHQGTGDFGTTELRTRQFRRMFVAKLSPAGKFVWVAAAEEPEDLGEVRLTQSEGRALVVQKDGGVVVTGSFRQALTLGGKRIEVHASKEPVGGGSYEDLFLAAFDAQGKNRWALSAGGPHRDTGQQLVLSPNGTLFVLGETRESATFGASSVKASGDPSQGGDVLLWRMTPPTR